jgi:hypothetical protein
MENFQDRLARLTELTADELTALETEMVAAFDAADASGDVESMQQLADALDEVRAASANAEPQAEPVEEAAVAAAADVIDETETPVAADTPTSETDVPAAPAVPVVAEDPAAVPAVPPVAAEGAAPVEAPADAADAENAEPETAAEHVAEIVAEAEEIIAEAAADAPPAEQVAPIEGQEATVAEEVTNEDVPEENTPVLADAAPNYSITAGGDIPGVTAGAVLADMPAVYEALTAKINGMRGVGGDGEQVVVASIATGDYSDEKTLLRSDPHGNSAKIRAIVETGQNGGSEALTAAGWCAPKTPIYDHVNGMAMGVTDTPVLDSFPSLGVDRGGIVWNAPMTLASLGSNVTGNFGRWTNIAAAGAPPNFVWSTDGAAAGRGVDALGAPAGIAGEKPCIDIPCPPEVTAEIGALPLCLCTDVLMSRANPEFIKHFTDLVMVAQARYKEQWAMTEMTKVATKAGAITGDVLGVARDMLVKIRVAASNFRWENRLSPTQDLRVYLPSWLRDAMAADLCIQMPGDDTLSVSYAVVEGYIGDLNVSPVWYIDDNVTLGPSADDSFDTDMGFAADFTWWLTVPGVMVHLDGGSLDLGVVRTKQDIQNNRFCEFAETFDGIAYMGPTGGTWLLQYAQAVDIRGGFAPAVAATALATDPYAES